MRTVMLEEAEGGAQRQAVEYYFLAPDGTGFKVAQPSPAYSSGFHVLPSTYGGKPSGAFIWTTRLE